MTQPLSQFTQLPLEILLKILQEVDNKAVLSCAQLSPLLNAACVDILLQRHNMQDPAVYCEVQLTVSESLSQDPPPDVLSAMLVSARRYPRMRHLHCTILTPGVGGWLGSRTRSLKEQAMTDRVTPAFNRLHELLSRVEVLEQFTLNVSEPPDWNSHPHCIHRLLEPLLHSIIGKGCINLQITCPAVPFADERWELPVPSPVPADPSIPSGLSLSKMLSSLLGFFGNRSSNNSSQNHHRRLSSPLSYIQPRITNLDVDSTLFQPLGMQWMSELLAHSPLTSFTVWMGPETPATWFAAHGFAALLKGAPGLQSLSVLNAGPQDVQTIATRLRPFKSLQNLTITLTANPSSDLLSFVGSATPFAPDALEQLSLSSTLVDYMLLGTVTAPDLKRIQVMYGKEDRYTPRTICEDIESVSDFINKISVPISIAVNLVCAGSSILGDAVFHKYLTDPFAEYFIEDLKAEGPRILSRVDTLSLELHPRQLRMLNPSDIGGIIDLVECFSGAKKVMVGGVKDFRETPNREAATLRSEIGKGLVQPIYSKCTSLESLWVGEVEYLRPLGVAVERWDFALDDELKLSASKQFVELKMAMLLKDSPIVHPTQDACTPSSAIELLPQELLFILLRHLDDKDILGCTQIPFLNAAGIEILLRRHDVQDVSAQCDLSVKVQENLSDPPLIDALAVLLASNRSYLHIKSLHCRFPPPDSYDVASFSLPYNDPSAGPMEDRVAIAFSDITEFLYRVGSLGAVHLEVLYWMKFPICFTRRLEALVNAMILEKGCSDLYIETGTTALAGGHRWTLPFVECPSRMSSLPRMLTNLTCGIFEVDDQKQNPAHQTKLTKLHVDRRFFHPQTIGWVSGLLSCCLLTSFTISLRARAPYDEEDTFVEQGLPVLYNQAPNLRTITLLRASEAEVLRITSSLCYFVALKNLTIYATPSTWSPLLDEATTIVPLPSSITHLSISPVLIDFVLRRLQTSNTHLEQLELVYTGESPGRSSIGPDTAQVREYLNKVPALRHVALTVRLGPLYEHQRSVPFPQADGSKQLRLVTEDSFTLALRLLENPRLHDEAEGFHAVGVLQVDCSPLKLETQASIDSCVAVISRFSRVKQVVLRGVNSPLRSPRRPYSYYAPSRQACRDVMRRVSLACADLTTVRIGEEEYLRSEV
ncbi:hypothetical protein NMY22_g7166 [Coprinellus aureogranulatus]|nr:hypothetical protein NMY22_g7166 [Coprinellus aureogranulatus]